MKINSLFLYFSLFILFSGSIFAQEVFQITALTHTESKLVDMKFSLNGGTIALGQSIQTGTNYVELEKLFLNYSSQWSYSYYATDSVIRPAAITEAGDRGYIVAGQIIQAGTNADTASDILLFKTDENGQLIWSERIDHYYSDQPTSVLNSVNGSIYIASLATTTSLPPLYNISLIKCDSIGQTLWSKSIGGGGNKMPSSLILTSDDQLAMAGTSSNSSSGASFFLAKFDTSGNYSWFKTYVIGFEDTCHAVLQTNDGGYMLVGSGGLNGNDIILIKVDFNGTLQTARSYNLGFGSNKNIDKGIKVLNTSDGGYAIAGRSEQVASELPFFFIIKLSQNLVVEWYNTFGFQLKQDFASFLQTADHGYLISGSRRLIGMNGLRNVLVKTDSSGQTSCLQTIVDLTSQSESPFTSSVNPSSINTITSQTAFALSTSTPVYLSDTSCFVITNVADKLNSSPFRIYPNPFRNKINIYSPTIDLNRNLEILVLDQVGRSLFSTDNLKSESGATIEINLPDIESGIYLLCVRQGGKIIQTKKIICAN